jgi:hypothetical protein
MKQRPPNYGSKLIMEISMNTPMIHGTPLDNLITFMAMPL